jgi:hypothetical protein
LPKYKANTTGKITAEPQHLLCNELFRASLIPIALLVIHGVSGAKEIRFCNSSNMNIEKKSLKYFIKMEEEI